MLAIFTSLKRIIPWAALAQLLFSIYIHHKIKYFCTIFTSWEDLGGGLLMV
jgi:hypothetical protein